MSILHSVVEVQHQDLIMRLINMISFVTNRI